MAALEAATAGTSATPYAVVDLDAFDRNAADARATGRRQAAPRGEQVGALPPPPRPGARPARLPRRARVHAAARRCGWPPTSRTSSSATRAPTSDALRDARRATSSSSTGSRSWSTPRSSSTSSRPSSAPTGHRSGCAWTSTPRCGSSGGRSTSGCGARPLHAPEELRRMAEAVVRRPRFRLVRRHVLRGADRGSAATTPGTWGRRAGIRAMQRISASELRERRAAAVAAVQAVSAARVRQRRRHRQPRADRRGGLRHRHRGRLRTLRAARSSTTTSLSGPSPRRSSCSRSCADPDRSTSPCSAAGGWRPARPGPTGCPRRCGRQGLRLVRTRERARCRPRWSARPRPGCTSGTGSGSATPRPASCASTSISCTWSTGPWPWSAVRDISWRGALLLVAVTTSDDRPEGSDRGTHVRRRTSQQAGRGSDPRHDPRRRRPRHHPRDRRRGRDAARGVPLRVPLQAGAHGDGHRDDRAAQSRPTSTRPSSSGRARTSTTSCTPGSSAYLDHVVAHPEEHLVTYELTATALRERGARRGGRPAVPTTTSTRTRSS